MQRFVASVSLMSTSTIRTNMIKFIRDNFGWVKDVGIVIFLVLVMWANAHYVTVEKFEAYQKANDLAHASTAATLVSVDKTLALMQQNQELLVENQRDIKNLTTRVVSIESDLKLLDSLGIANQLQTTSTKLIEMDFRIKSLEAVRVSSPK